MPEETLSLESSEVVGYAEHCLRNERRTTMWLARLGAVLFMSWSPLDFAFEAAHARTFLVLRCLTVLIAVVFSLVLRATSSLRVVRFVGGLAIVLSGGAIAYMMPRVEHYAIYLMGFSSLFWGAGLFLQWPARVAALTFGTLFTTYIVFDLVAPNHGRPLIELAGGALYLGTAGTLMTGLAAVRTTAARHAYVLGARLDRRNEEVTARERAIRLLMDSTGDGLLGVALSGALTGTASHAVTARFGEVRVGQKIWDYIAPHDAAFREMFELGFGQMADDFLPFDVAVDQMPSRLRRDGSVYSLRFRQVFEEGAVVSLLAILEDVTLADEGERAEKRAREVHAIMLRVVRDREGVLTFIKEAEDILADLEKETEATTVKRLVHTLKGNSALCGFGSVAEHCHVIETELLESGAAALNAEQHGRLHESFHERLATITDLLPREGDDAIALRARDVRELTATIEAGGEREELLEIVASWRWPRASDALGRLSAQISRIGASLGKPIAVSVQHGGIRLAPHTFEAFFSALVHVARNAADHGIEDAETRRVAAKPATGAVLLSARVDDAGLVLEVADDGQGIDLERLAVAAAKHGLPLANDDDVMAVLFTDGVTTRDAATEHSGRGVGLAAVRAACEKAGGHVRVTWAKGRGTTFTFVFPRALARAPAAYSSGAEGRGAASLAPAGFVLG